MSAIDFTAMTHGAQLLERQADHGRAIEEYLRRETDLSGDLGLLLLALAPAAAAVRELGARGAQLSTLVSDSAAANLTQSIRDYVRADEDMHAQISRLLTRLGAPTVPWEDPTAGIGPLGPAQGGASADYGDQPDWVWERGTDLADHLDEQARAAREAAEGVSDWFSPGTPVTEAEDASSYLVAPVPGENVVQDLRWGAGLALGGIDWVAEKLLGFSILEEVVYKPFAGDWQQISAASLAWGHGADAVRALGANFSALASTTGAWTGEAGQAFRATMAAVGAAHLGLSLGYGAVSGYVSTVATACRLACAGIGFLLNKLANLLIEIAIEATNPAGWVVLVATAYDKINTVVRGVRLAYSLIDAITDAITEVIEGKIQLLEFVGALEDLAEWAARSAQGQYA